MLTLALSVSAFRIEHGNNVAINQPVNENLYIAGGTITINAPVHGDLIVAGGTIVINDTVTNDILLAGGNVTFNGFVGDDIRCAGGDLHIVKNVTGDVVVAGGKVMIDQGVEIGNLLLSGGEATLNGKVKGEVKSAVGNFTFNGSAQKLVCRAGKIDFNGTVMGKTIIAAPEIVIGSDAIFHDDVRYWNKQGSLDFKQSLKNGTAIFDPSLKIERGGWHVLGFSLLGVLWFIGMAFLMIILLQYFFSPTMKNAGDTFITDSLKSLGVGFLFLTAFPVLIILSFVTIIGLPVGVILLFFYIMALLFATTITSVVVTNWIHNRKNYKWNFWQLVGVALGIFTVLKLISFIPFIGWLFMLIMACIAFGAILLNIQWRREHQQPEVIE